MEILLSIIIPVYNSDRYIRKCIDSILISYIRSCEIIIIDDGSTDSTLSICMNYAQNNPNIIVKHQKNKGVSEARNRGIEIATGKYLMFVDSDDFIDNNIIPSLINSIQSRDFAVCGYTLYDNRTQSCTHEFPCFSYSGTMVELSENIEQYLWPPYLLGPCSKLFKSSIIKEYNIRFYADISYCEDAIFVFDFLRYAKTFISIKCPGYIYRRHGNETLSTSFRENLFDCEVILNDRLNTFLNNSGVYSKVDICKIRLFKAFVLYIQKLALSKMSHRHKILIVQSVERKYNLKQVFDNIRCRSLDDHIAMWLLNHPKHISILNLIKMEVLCKNNLNVVRYHFRHY
jgi:glycosyltransferase involved in cell wall biosynthesis